RGDGYALHQTAGGLELSPGETEVELGPGLGHPTRHLIDTGARAVAVARDPATATGLASQAREGRAVVPGNAAQIRCAQAAGRPHFALAANLPYRLTAPILFQVLEQREPLTRVVFTLQQEVVTRLASPPGTRAYGLLSALLGLFFEVEELLQLPAHMFHPPPKVDSAVVRLAPYARPLAEITSDARFIRVVKAGFAQRRKTLLNSLKSDPGLGTPDHLRAALESAGIDPNRRAETLSPQEFAALERALPTFG